MLWEENYLAHYGIEGMRWGVRRFQNKDGSLTEAGKKRYGASVEEVKQKLDQARLKEHEAKAKYERKQNRRIQINPFEPVHSGKKYAKAMKQVNKIEEVYQKLPKDQKVSDLLVGSGEKKGLLKKLSDHFEAQFYPPELRGKSKEEKKAWEERERKKFDAYVEKEKADRIYNKKLNKFDKLSEGEKNSVLEETASRIDKLEKKQKEGGLTRDERHELDGLSDWYQSNRKPTSDERKDLYSEGKKDGAQAFKDVDSIKDPEERGKRLGDMFQKANDALGPYADSTYPGYDEDKDPKKQAYDIAICNELDRKVKGICDPLGLRGNGMEGHTPGTKAITDRIEELQNKQSEVYRDTVHTYKAKNNIEKLTSSDLAKITDLFRSDPRISNWEKEATKLQEKDLLEQIVKDLGLPVTSQNIKNVYPFIYNDPFDD